MTVSTQGGLLGSSAVMAAGTVVSRITGFAKASVIAATLGLATVTADTFNVPSVIPTTLYILVGGGILNSVLVPVLVRAIKEDADGGEAYSQRLFSVVVVFLGAATIVAVLAAPWIVAAFVNSKFRTPELEPFFDNMVLFARFCLPQIFFYGLYVLIGQMLNARGRFGPMMWAPILNNLVVITVFTSYLLVVGQKSAEPFTDSEILFSVWVPPVVWPSRHSPWCPCCAGRDSASACVPTGGTPGSVRRPSSGCGRLRSSLSTRWPTCSSSGQLPAGQPTRSSTPVPLVLASRSTPTRC